LEISAAWTVSSYAECPMFDGKTMTLTTSTGSDVFRVAAAEIMGLPPEMEHTKKYVLLRNGTTFGRRNEVVELSKQDADILLRNKLVVEYQVPCTQNN